MLAIRPTANATLDTGEYDFRVFDDPAEMHALVELKNRANNRSRVVAGYCWPWPSKKDPQAWDITLPGYRRRWNLDQDGSLWIVTPGSVEQVGCIHTCQGLELDYVGVIIGPDLVLHDGQVQADATRRAASDQSVRGLKKMLRESPQAAARVAERIVKNTYRTLMSRVMKGCYVHCTDPALAAHLRARLRPLAEPVPAPVRALPLPRADRHTGVPLVDLRFAAGAFSDWQALEAGAEHWVALPDGAPPQRGLFVAQVVGESMNRRVPNGAWCVFRANPGGSREGRIVVVQHRAIDDPETGGRYTLKRYHSEKVADPDGGWRHLRITLKPESDRPGFEPLVLEAGDNDDGFAVIAELLYVLA